MPSNECRFFVLLLVVLATLGGAVAAPEGAVTTKKSSSGTISSSVKCSATAIAGSVEKSVDAYAEAMIRLVRGVCHKKFDGKLEKVRKAMGEDVALALAKTVASVAVKCEYKGKAEGCAKGKAYSSAWSKAIAVALAKAKAEAEIKKYCKCGVGAEALAEGIAKAAAKLYADSESYASAKVCRAGRKPKNFAVAYNKCLALALVDATAEAVAKVLIKGDCSPRHGKYALAFAKIEANASLDWSTKEKCINYEFVKYDCKHCDADAYGNTYAAVWEL